MVNAYYLFPVGGGIKPFVNRITTPTLDASFAG